MLRNPRTIVALILAIGATVSAISPVLAAPTPSLVVRSTADSGPGSLREVLAGADLQGGTVSFDVPDGAAIELRAPLAAFDHVTIEGGDAVTIRGGAMVLAGGSTVRGVRFDASPLVLLGSGNLVEGSTFTAALGHIGDTKADAAVTVGGAGNRVRGNRAEGALVAIQQATGTVVEDNHVRGVTTSGVAAVNDRASVIRNNVIEGDGVAGSSGVVLVNSAGAQVTGNAIGFAPAVQALGVERLVVEGTTVAHATSPKAFAVSGGPDPVGPADAIVRDNTVAVDGAVRDEIAPSVVDTSSLLGGPPARVSEQGNRVVPGAAAPGPAPAPAPASEPAVSEPAAAGAAPSDLMPSPSAPAPAPATAPVATAPVATAPADAAAAASAPADPPVAPDSPTANAVAPATAAADLRRALDQAQSSVGTWASLFDLASLDLATRATPLPAFELPVVTKQLAAYFGTATSVASTNLPDVDGTANLTAAVTLLKQAGCTITFASGVTGEVQPAGNDIVEAACPLTNRSLSKVASFAGDGFNDNTPNVFQDIATASSLDGGASWGAQLNGSFVVGVDTSGPYLGGDTRLGLAVSGTSSLSGTASQLGRSGLVVSGSGTGALTVGLRLGSTAGTRLRLADLVATPASRLLVPTLSGTASVTLGASAPQITTSWTGTWTTASVNGVVTVPAPQQTFTAAATLPGLTSGGAPATLALTGATATQGGVNGWVLHGTASAVANPKLAGFSLQSLVVDAFASPGSLAGTGSARLLIASGGPTPIPLDVALTFGPHAITVHGEATLQKQVIGVAPATVYVDGAKLIADLTLDLDTGTVTNTNVRIDGTTAGIAVLLPQGTLPPAPGVVPPGAGTLTGFSGALSPTGNVTLHAATAQAVIGNGDLTADLTNVDVAFGPGASGPLVSVASVTAKIPALANLSVTVTGLTLSRTALAWSAASATASVSGFSGTLGIAGILTFTFTSVSVSFPNLTDLSTFTARVTGSFAFGGFAGLPFTPVLTVGAAQVTPSSSPAQNNFTFDIAIDAGTVVPLNIPPITLGFTDLRVAGVTFAGGITLGGITNGVVNPTLGGSLGITAGVGIVSGSASASVTGTIGATSIDADVTFSLSGSIGLSPPINFTGADLKLHLRFDRNGGTLTLRPQFDGLGLDTFRIPLGANVAFTAANVTLNLTPPAGQPIVSFGANGGLGVSFASVPVLAGWSGTVHGFAIGADLVPCALPGFGADITFPANFNAALPSWLPIQITGAGFALGTASAAGSVGGCVPFTDLTNVKVNISGGLNVATLPNVELFPIDASVSKLELDINKLVSGQFPLTGLNGVSFGVAPFDIAGVKVGGNVGIGTLQVDATTVFYVRVSGTVEVAGIGAGIDLVVTQFGPVLAAVSAPLGIPLGPSGVVLAGARGELRFGPPTLPEPDPNDPLALLSLPIFAELGDPTITTARIQAAVTPAVRSQVPTWATGGTLSVSGTFIHVAAPGMVKGTATIAANVAPGTGVNLFGKGQLDLYGMPYGTVGFRVDLSDPIAPKFNFASAVPSPGSPLGLIIPAQANLGAVLDTKGLAVGTVAGVGAFCDRLAKGTLQVGGALFDSAAGAVAASLEADRLARRNDGAYRALTAAVLDTNGNGVVEAAEQKVITKAILKTRLQALLPVGLPTDPVVINRLAKLAQVLITELTTAAGTLLKGANPIDPLGAGTEQLVAAGSKAAAAFVTVVNQAVRDSLGAFLAVADPRLTITGAARPVVLGVPLGPPTAQVGITISKDRMGVQLFANLAELVAAASSVPPGPVVLAATPLQSTLGINAELPVAGALSALVGGTSYPTADPGSAWGVTITGGVNFYRLQLAQLTGMIVPPGNPTFVDAHVQKLFNGEVFNPADITRPVPLTTQQQYDELVARGGLVFTGALSAPELLTDPIGLANRLNLTPPTDPLQIPAWLAAIGAAAGSTISPGFLQLYLPPPGSPGAGAAARLSGQWNAKLASLPISKGSILATAQGLEVTGSLPLAGLTGKVTIQEPNAGSTLPKTSADISLDTSNVNAALDDLGLPATLRLPSAVSQAAARLLAFSPGFDPAAVNPDGTADLLRRRGGVQFDADITVPNLVSSAHASFSVTPSSSGDLFRPDFTATASVSNLTLHPNVTIASARLDLRSVAGVTTVHVQGTGTAFGITATIVGDLNADGTGSLTVTAAGGVDVAPGFHLAAGLSLVLSSTGITVSFNGQLTLPTWLSARVGLTTVSVNGVVASDGSFDLALAVTNLPLDLAGTVRLTTKVTNPATPLVRLKRTTAGVITVELHGQVTLASGGLPLLTVDGAVSTAGTGNLEISFGAGGVNLGGYVVTGGATVTFDASVSPAKLDIAVHGTLSIPGVISAATVSGKIDGNGIASLSITVAGTDTGGQALGMAGVQLSSLSLSLTRTKVSPLSYTLNVAAAGSITGVVSGVTLNGTVTSAGAADLSIGVATLGLPGGVSLTNASFRLKRSSVSTTVTGTGTFGFAGASMGVTGSLTMAAAGPSGTLTVTIPAGAKLGPFTLGGTFGLVLSPTASSVSVTNATVKLDGWSRALTMSGSLASTGLGSVTLTIGATPLTLTGTPFTIGGTFTLTRTSTATTATATNATLGWTGIGSFTISTLTVSTTGAINVAVAAKSFTLAGGLVLNLGASSFVTDPGALAARLVVGSSTLSIPGIATGASALTLPGFTVTLGDFTLTLANGSFSLGALQVTGRFLFEKSGSVLSVRATSTTTGLPVRLKIGAFGTIDLTTFVIASNGTFDVGVTVPQIGPSSLRLRNASMRFTRTTTATTLTVSGGELLFPIGQPVALPNFTIGTAATVDQTFTFGLNFGDLFSVQSAQYRFRITTDGVAHLDLVDVPDSSANQPVVSALAGSGTIKLIAFSADSTGLFTGQIRGRIGVFGRQLATVTMTVARQSDRLRITVPSTTLDLGFVEMTASGFYDTTGRFSFTGTASATAGSCDALCLSGTVSMTVSSTNGIDGSFSGRVCVVFCGETGGSVSSTGRVTGHLLVAGLVDVDYTIDLGSSSSGDTTRPNFADDPLPPISVRGDAVNGVLRVNYDLPVATDDSGVRPSVVCTPTSGIDFAVGDTTVTCVATDAAQNTRTRSFVITVIDNDAPTFVILAGGTLSVNVTGADALATGTLALHSDPTDLGSYPVDDDGRIVASAAVPADVPLGAHTLVLRCVDENGNPIIWQWNVRIAAAIDGTPEPTTTTTAGTTPTTDPMGAAAGTGAGRPPAVPSAVAVTPASGPLPATGQDVSGPVGLAAALAAAGGGCLLASRRRRRRLVAAEHFGHGLEA